MEKESVLFCGCKKERDEERKKEKEERKSEAHETVRGKK